LGIHLIIDAVIGEAVNVLTHLHKIDSFADCLIAFGIGAASGALTAATGGIMAGAAGAMMGSPVQGIGNHIK